MDPVLIQNRALDDLTKYRDEIHQISLSEVASFAERAVSVFFDYLALTGRPLREAIELLCEINSHPNPDFSKLGLDALFPNLIEKLNDSFDPALCEIYDHVFSQIISFCRRLPEMTAFDQTLTSFNLHNEASIFSRKRNLVSKFHLLSNDLPLKKILFLSRVTIGADVALTSVLMAQLKKVFPDAELVLLGSNKLSELYGGDAQIRIHEIQYGRGATLCSRLLSWMDVVRAVNEEISGLSNDQFCIIDPDSRLSQLGLLPICQDDSNYFFFESRSFQRDGCSSLGQLSSAWVNEICESPHLNFPFLALPKTKKSIGNLVTYHLDRPVISISFGVGGNDAKRLNLAVEAELVRSLLDSFTVIIDSGFSPSELAQADDLETIFRAAEIKILRLSENSLQQFSGSDFQNPQIIFWEGGIGSFASLISCSDQYIGYDSSGQHLAAAAGIPVLTIFSDSGSALFAKRWQPWGKSKTSSVVISTAQLSEPTSIMASSILAELLH